LSSESKMAKAVVRYMRAHGNTPGPTQRPKLAGALTAILAEAPALLLLWVTGGLEGLARILGTQVAVAILLHIGAMALAGALYGRLFSRAANDRRGGWLFGISYGFLLWMLGPVAALQWVVGRPVAVGRAAMGLLGAHLLYGLALGLLFPHTHRSLQRRLGNVSRLARRQENYGVTQDSTARRHK
jgi:hypothetical protein